MACENCKKNLMSIQYKGKNLCGPCYMKLFNAELEAHDAAKRSKRPPPGSRA